MQISWFNDNSSSADGTIEDILFEFGDSTEIGFDLGDNGGVRKFTFLFENTISGSSDLEVGEISFWSEI